MKKSYFISILIALSVGGLSAFITRDGMSIYEDIVSPPLSPPSILFPIVWTILFVLMGISSSIVFNSNGAPASSRFQGLFTYGISLAVNFFWSIIFFNIRWFGFAFFWLLGLLFFIIKTIVCYQRVNKLAAYLQIPYSLWVAFAGYLNFSIWMLNM